MPPPRCNLRPEVVRVLLGLRLSDAVASDVKSGGAPPLRTSTFMLPSCAS